MPKKIVMPVFFHFLLKVGFHFFKIPLSSVIIGFHVPPRYSKFFRQFIFIVINKQQGVRGKRHNERIAGGNRELIKVKVRNETALQVLRRPCSENGIYFSCIDVQLGQYAGALIILLVFKSVHFGMLARNGENNPIIAACRQTGGSCRHPVKPVHGKKLGIWVIQYFILVCVLMLPVNLPCRQPLPSRTVQRIGEIRKNKMTPVRKSKQFVYPLRFARSLAFAKVFFTKLSFAVKYREDGASVIQKINRIS